jgi:hypothetical protein
MSGFELWHFAIAIFLLGGGGSIMSRAPPLIFTFGCSPSISHPPDCWGCSWREDSWQSRSGSPQPVVSCGHTKIIQLVSASERHENKHSKIRNKLKFDRRRKSDAPAFICQWVTPAAVGI